MRKLKVGLIYSGRSDYPRWTWGIYKDTKEDALLKAPYTAYKTRRACVRSLNRVVNAIRHGEFQVYKGMDWNVSSPGMLTANIRYSSGHLGWQIVLISANHRLAAISSAFATSALASRAWWAMREDLHKHNFCRFEFGPKRETTNC